MRPVPKTYLAALVLLVLIATLTLLVYFAVPPFDNLSVFILASTISVITLLIAGVVGGAFVGMLLAQRLLGNREFSLFEKTVLQSLSDIRERLEKLEAAAPDEEKKLRR